VYTLFFWTKNKKTLFYFYLKDLTKSFKKKRCLSFLLDHFGSISAKRLDNLPCQDEDEEEEEVDQTADVEEIEPDDEEPWAPNGGFQKWG
jgi:hypothetical protein